MRSRIASERLVYPFFFMSLSNCLSRTGSIETPNLVMFSIVTRFTGKRSTNLNFLLPKSFLKTYCFRCHEIQKSITYGGKIMGQSGRQKYILFVLGAIVLLLCNTISVQADETTTNIICTNSVLADFVANVITENVSIDYIMPAGVCPAHFDTCPSDVSKIASGDVIISLGWEPWLTSLLDASGNTDYKEIKCAQLGEWNIPTGAKKYVEKIRDELSLIFPGLNNTIHANAQGYMTQINETAEDLRNMIRTKEYQGKQVVCMEWQHEFLTWLGLNVTHYYGPPEQLSTHDMLNASNAAQTGEVYAIIDNLQSGTDFGARIASEAGASHVIFTNFPGAVPGADTYLELITYNTEQLINGMANYEYKQGEIAQLETQVSSLELQRNVALLGIFVLAMLCGLFIVLYKRK